MIFPQVIVNGLAFSSGNMLASDDSGVCPTSNWIDPLSLPSLALLEKKLCCWFVSLLGSNGGNLPNKATCSTLGTKVLNIPCSF